MPYLVEIYSVERPVGWAAWYKTESFEDAERFDFKDTPRVRIRQLSQPEIDYLFAKANAERALVQYIDANAKAYNLKIKLKERVRC